MKIVYELKVLERDDYIFSHDTLICKILEIDDTKKQVIEQITVINGEETRRNTTEKVYINGEFVSLSSSSKYFNSIDEVKSHINKEYELIKSNKFYFFFIDIDTSDNIFVINNLIDSGYGLAKDFINLQELLQLKFDK